MKIVIEPTLWYEDKDGYDLEQFQQAFLKPYEERSASQRTWTREYYQPYFDEGAVAGRAKAEAYGR